MSMYWYAVRRVGLAVVMVYLMLTITFGFAAFTDDPQVAMIQHNMARGGASEAEIQEAVEKYEKAHNLDASLGERYVEWLVSMTTLDWGRSFTTGQPVMAAVLSAMKSTFRYALPAVLLSMVGGVSVGLYSATRSGSVVERIGNGLGYVGLGLPGFWIAAVLEILFLYPLYRETVLRVGPSDPQLVARIATLKLVFAALALGMTMFAGQLRYAQAEAREYAGTQFIKVVRAKGAGSLRVARHILRNAAIPFVSLFFTDMLAVLVVNVYVIEYVLGIGGIGSLTLMAIQQRDTPLIVGATMAVVFVGIVGNLFQDFVYTVLDPRVEYD